MIGLYIALGLAGFIVLYLILVRLVRKTVHFPAPAFIGRFLDSDFRRMLQPPGPIIGRSGIRPGMKVLEIGCGSGAYTLFVAEAVGREGKVFALDIQRRMLDKIERKISAAGGNLAKNIELIEASAYDIPLGDNILDVVYLITVLQEIPDKARALQEARRVLKPGGTIAVTEFLPDPDYPLVTTTKRDLDRAGFHTIASEGNLWTYTVRGRK